jgi:hypothetical protein
MNTLLVFLIVWTFVCSFASGEEVVEPKQAESTEEGIEFTEDGIHLYGKFRFESEGELFDIFDKESKVLIPAGAVLTCIRKSYTIGYFGGGAMVNEGTKLRQIPKVFFILKPSGVITYHSPSPDGNFPGKLLPDSIEFGKLYDPQKIPAEKGE